MRGQQIDYARLLIDKTDSAYRYALPLTVFNHVKASNISSAPAMGFFLESCGKLSSSCCKLINDGFDTGRVQRTVTDALVEQADAVSCTTAGSGP
jgi:hypothetical protein